MTQHLKDNSNIITAIALIARRNETYVQIIRSNRLLYCDKLSRSLFLSTTFITE